MRRWHQDRRVAVREWRKHYRNHVEFNKRDQWPRRIGRDPYEIDCPCDGQVGRFRKTDAWDCGNTRCGICHSDKFPVRDLTGQERRADVAFREQTKEFDRD